jgi:hypothetical protein
VIPKSVAINGSRLAGRNPLVTSVKTATIRAITPSHPDPDWGGGEVPAATGLDAVLVIVLP